MDTLELLKQTRIALCKMRNTKIKLDCAEYSYDLISLIEEKIKELDEPRTVTIYDLMATHKWEKVAKS